MMNVTQKPLAKRQQVALVFFGEQNKWLASSDICCKLGTPGSQTIYVTVNNMLSKGDLERKEKTDQKGYVYRLTDLGKNRYEKLSTSADFEVPVKVEVQDLAKENAEYKPGVDVKVASEGITQARLEVVAEGISGRKPRVQWTHEERKQIATEIVKARLAFPIGFCEALVKAQLTLPTERRRLDKVKTKAQLDPWIDTYLKNVNLEPKELSNQHAQKTQILTKHDPDPLLLVQDLAQVGIDSLLGEISKRFAASLESALLQVLSSKTIQDALLLRVEVSTTNTLPGAERERRHNPQPTGLDKPRLKRVLVFGLNKPNHVQEVTNEFKDLLDLRFCPTGKNRNELRAKCRSVDATVVMTDHVDHGSTDLLKCENVPFILLSGSIGKLKDKLSEIYCND